LGLPGAIADLLGIKKKGVVRVYRSPAKTSSEQLRKLFEEDFFTETLLVKKDLIDDFIYYADDHGLRDLLEKSNNQLAVIEFLVAQSIIYRTDRLD
jgi:hypothetical protein